MEPLHDPPGSHHTTPQTWSSVAAAAAAAATPQAASTRQCSTDTRRRTHHQHHGTRPGSAAAAAQGTSSRLTSSAGSAAVSQQSTATRLASSDGSAYRRGVPNQSSDIPFPLSDLVSLVVDMKLGDSFYQYDGDLYVSPYLSYGMKGAILSLYFSHPTCYLMCPVYDFSQKTLTECPRLRAYSDVQLGMTETAVSGEKFADAATRGLFEEFGLQSRVPLTATSPRGVIFRVSASDCSQSTRTYTETHGEKAAKVSVLVFGSHDEVFALLHMASLKDPKECVCGYAAMPLKLAVYFAVKMIAYQKAQRDLSPKLPQHHGSWPSDD